MQIERIPDTAALETLALGVTIGDHRTLPCRARRLDTPPGLAPRDPPIRARKNVRDCWLALELTEGKNRQVRRMTAAIGHPTLRLLRVRIGQLHFTQLALAQGSWRELTEDERDLVFVAKPPVKD